MGRSLAAILSLVVAAAVGFAGGYRYATRPLDDTGPKSGPLIIEKETPAKPPEPKHVQTPVVRETHPIDTVEVCLEADRAFMGLAGRAGDQSSPVPVRFTGSKLRNFVSLRGSWMPAVTYVDPVTERLAVTRRRNGSLLVPYTYKGTTRIDTYAFNPPSWDIFLEVEGKLFGDSFALVAPKAAQGNLMLWLRIRRVELGVGARAYVEDGNADVGSVAGVRWRVWGLQ